ncbi:MAG: T9SS type A sorting domain-containing protein [Saprospiraceae bacterium]
MKNNNYCSFDPNLINESSIISNINFIYPNPADNIMYINEYFYNENTECKILDITGRILLSSNNQSININSLSPGIYFVILKNMEGTFINKLIKI